MRNVPALLQALQRLVAILRWLGAAIGALAIGVAAQRASSMLGVTTSTTALHSTLALALALRVRE